MAYRQVDVSRWPETLHWTVAMLKYVPADLERMLRVRFELTSPRLGSLEAVLFERDGGALFALARHRGASVKDTCIIIDHGAQYPRQELDEILGVLNIRHDALTWTNMYCSP